MELQSRLEGLIKRFGGRRGGGQLDEQHGRMRVGLIGIRALFKCFHRRLLGILQHRCELRMAITRVFQALFRTFGDCRARAKGLSVRSIGVGQGFKPARMFHVKHTGEPCRVRDAVLISVVTDYGKCDTSNIWLGDRAKWNGPYYWSVHFSRAWSIP